MSTWFWIRLKLVLIFFSEEDSVRVKLSIKFSLMFLFGKALIKLCWGFKVLFIVIAVAKKPK